MHVKSISMPCKRLLAFTLVELLSCIVIISILASLLYPILGSVKLSAKATSAKAGLRNLFLATALYRSDYEGVEFGEPSAMGLPFHDDQGRDPALAEIFRNTLGSDPNQFSPCGWHPKNRTEPVIEYMASNRPDWANWILKLESRTILFADGNCNATDVDVSDQFAMKRGIGVALDGHVLSVVNDQSHIWLQNFYLRGIQ